MILQEKPVTKQEFRVKGYIPVAMYAEIESRRYVVAFENDTVQEIAHDTYVAWAVCIKAWAAGTAW